MTERTRDIIERVEAIFGELGYTVYDKEETDEAYEGSFKKNDQFLGTIYIENDSNFIEFANTLTFDIAEESFFKKHLEPMLDICYENGCYFNILEDEDEINFHVFSKIYFSGLNVESLEDTLEDFNACNQELELIFEIEEGDSNIDSEDIDQDNP
jgi:hypothetical protein